MHLQSSNLNKNNHYIKKSKPPTHTQCCVNNNNSNNIIDIDMVKNKLRTSLSSLYKSIFNCFQILLLQPPFINHLHKTPNSIAKPPVFTFNHRNRNRYSILLQSSLLKLPDSSTSVHRTLTLTILHNNKKITKTKKEKRKRA